MKPELFGTDGIRGVAGQFPLDLATVTGVGRALGAVLARAIGAHPVRVLLGEDTRESSSGISRALAAGLRATEAEVVNAGVITTPAVAFLTRHHGFACGVVVSASHNPYTDNGIKVFAGSGTKLPESLELEVERELKGSPGGGDEDGEISLQPEPHLLEDYVEHLCGLAPEGAELSGYRLVVDCAHGAASRVVPMLIQRLGIEARILHAQPDGRNINRGCGSLHPQVMVETTQALGADLGVAFDGDADRSIFATGRGRLADGDHVLFAMAPYYQQRGILKGGAVVGTLMTNLALQLALARHGIGLKRAAVGDRYVLEEMLRFGINLGGEPSGHIIFADLALAGDGLLSLLQVLRLMLETRQPFEALVGEFQPFPQTLLNVRVREKPPLESIPGVARAIQQCRRELGERGRLAVRYSGTEPIARVMVEAEDAVIVQRHAASIAAAINSAVGLG